MAQLFVEPSAVARARELARSAALGVQAFIDRHTTVSIERTVLRLLGISGAGSRGAPLANLMVDRLREAGVLRRGRLTGWAAPCAPRRARIRSQRHRARRRAIPRSCPRSARRKRRSFARRCGREARSAHARAAARIDQRRELKRSLQVGSFPGAPWKYVIVATGNIYDDAIQAKAAAQAGADIIAVIRATAQSLLDYVPHGATTEGYGGTFATQENFRIMREALDDEQRRSSAATSTRRTTRRACACAEIACDGGGRAARHAAQRRDVRHPLPRHQHVAHLRRPVLLAPDHRALAASSSTPARTTTSPPPTPWRRRTRCSPRSSSTRRSRKRAGLTRRADGARPRLRDRPVRSRTASSARSRRRS